MNIKEINAIGVNERLDKLERIFASHDLDVTKHCINGIEGFAYDASGYLTSFTVWKNEAMTQKLYREEYYYSAIGLLTAMVSTIFVNENNKIVKRYEYSYDGSGNITKVIMR